MHNTGSGRRSLAPVSAALCHVYHCIRHRICRARQSTATNNLQLLIDNAQVVLFHGADTILQAMKPNSRSNSTQYGVTVPEDQGNSTMSRLISVLSLQQYKLSLQHTHEEYQATIMVQCSTSSCCICLQYCKCIMK